MPVALAHTLQILISSPNNPKLHCLLNYSHSSEGGTFVRTTPFRFRFSKKMALKSFIEVHPDSHFPIQNLPYGVFKPEPASPARPGVAIGDYVLDLSVVASAGLFDGPVLKNNCDSFLQVRPGHLSITVIHARCSATKRCRFDSLNLDKIKWTNQLV